MNTENHSQTAAFLWSVADLLRGDFKQSQYGRIILPFTLLRATNGLQFFNTSKLNLASLSDTQTADDLMSYVQAFSRDEELMAQVNSHSTEQVMHGLFPKRMTDVVLDVMTDSEQWPEDVRKMSMEVLDNADTTRQFGLLILKMLKAAAIDGQARRAVAGDE